ncbi:hypothetical protein [Streptomyces sp. NPDC006334]|uniref:hypothetical protein n=1 Tax=Streptomyces sp. NPDC006334 TaxID=3156754 RepID=UPI0033A1D212
MDGGLAAILAGAIGVAGTSLGGLSANYGTKIGAEANAAALLQQVRRQTEAERSQWVRGRRAAAYQQFLEVWDEYTLTRFQVRMVGPESVTAVADEVLNTVMAMQLPGEVEAELHDVHARFRENPSPELKNRMVEIAEEILYRGSWDAAIDVGPLRASFLDAVSEALGSL